MAPKESFVSSSVYWRILLFKSSFKRFIFTLVELLNTNLQRIPIGVTFDPTLSFNKHISVTVSSCMSKLAQISRAKHAFNSDLLVIIINALAFSKLYYCSSVWSNTSASNMQKLQLVQNFAARTISGATKFEHITPSLKNLGWLPVKKQVYFRDAIFAFKCMTGCAPTYLTSQFVTRRQISDRTTRNSQQLNIPLFKTAAGQRSFH